MTREEAIQEACEIVALAYHSIGNYTSPSDGFCEACRAKQAAWSMSYTNDGEVFNYVRGAVLKQLRRDGHKIDPGFDRRTGRPKESK